MIDETVLILRYERLVADTVGVMREVASFAGIRFADVLTMPPFNGRPIRSNSTRPPEHGVLAWPASRHRKELSPAEAARIEELTADLL